MTGGARDAPEGFSSTIQTRNELPAAMELPRLSIEDAVGVGEHVAVREECPRAQEARTRARLIVPQLPDGGVGVLCADDRCPIVLANDGV